MRGSLALAGHLRIRVLSFSRWDNSRELASRRGHALGHEQDSETTVPDSGSEVR